MSFTLICLRNFILFTPTYSSVFKSFLYYECLKYFFLLNLGTTFSCVGVYHAVSGAVDILEAQDGHQCIPSVVAVRSVILRIMYENISCLRNLVIQTVKLGKLCG